MKKLRFLTLGFGLLTLTACTTMQEIVDDIKAIEIPGFESQDRLAEEFVIKGNCPDAEIVEDLSALSEFATTQDTSEMQLITRAHLSDIQSKCSYNERSMTVDVKLSFEGAIGPQAAYTNTGTPVYSYPFFVAITSPKGDILAKEIFSATMDFSGGENYQTYSDSLRQIIPLVDPDSGRKHKILVGFQLNQDQLNYNRMILEQQRAAEQAAIQAEEEAAKAAAKAQEKAMQEPQEEIEFEQPSSEYIIMRTPGSAQ